MIINRTNTIKVLNNTLKLPVEPLRSNFVTNYKDFTSLTIIVSNGSSFPLIFVFEIFF